MNKREYDKIYRIKNKDKISKRRKKYYFNNINIIKEKQQLYNLHHKTQKKKYDINRRKHLIFIGRCPSHLNTNAAPNHVHCWKCVNDRRNRRETTIKIGKCENHPEINSIDGRTLCRGCLNNARKRYKIAVKNRLCPSHLNIKCVPGRIFCKKCLEYKRNHSKQRRKIPEIALKIKMHDIKRREMKSKVIHNYTGEQWNKKKKSTGGYCLKKYGGCGKRVGYKKLTLDHIYPLSRAYDDYLKTGIKRVYTIRGVCPLCQGCNSSWHNKIR